MASRFWFPGDRSAHRFARYFARLAEADRRRLSRLQHVAWFASAETIIVFGPCRASRGLVTFDLVADLRRCDPRSDLAGHLAAELRRLAFQLRQTARRVEGGRP